MKSVTNNKWSGTTYNAGDGKSYSSDVIAAGPRKLEVRGCVMSILCGGETWTKIGEVTLKVSIEARRSIVVLPYSLWE